jgi:hypothetical protein
MFPLQSARGAMKHAAAPTVRAREPIDRIIIARTSVEASGRGAARKYRNPVECRWPLGAIAVSAAGV